MIAEIIINVVPIDYYLWAQHLDGVDSHIIPLLINQKTWFLPSQETF